MAEGTSHSEEVCLYDDVAVRLHMAAPASFHRKCLQENSHDGTDSTGLRVHAGAYVAIRFLRCLCGDIETLRGILGNKERLRIVECGSGTGIVGLYGALQHLWPHIEVDALLTDGNIEAVQLIDSNIQAFTSHIQKIRQTCNIQKSVAVRSQHLIWDNDEQICKAISSFGGGSFNIVLGCELVYYSTCTEALFAAMLRLLDRDCGLIIHTHIFRRENVGIEIESFFGERGFVTLEVPLRYLCSEKELESRPEFHKVRTLVSAAGAVAERLRAAQPSWGEFDGGAEEEQGEDYINCINL